MASETPAFIDALPYIDTAIDDESVERKIDEEVHNEMNIFPPDKDYLKYLPPISRTFVTPLIEHEHLCIEQKRELQTRPSAKELAEIRTDPPPPSNSPLDEEELTIWSKCLDQVKIKLEYRQRHLMNLELIKEYGEPAWRQYIEEQERLIDSLTEELNELEKKSVKVNLSRKTDQERICRTLEVLKKEWNTYLDKNRILSDEINKLSLRI